MLGENPLNNRRGRNIRDKRNVSHRSALAFHKLFSHNPVCGPIATFYQNVGPEGLNKGQRIRLVKNRHIVHAGQGRQHFSPLVSRDYRAVRALGQLPNRVIAVEPDHQPIPKALSFL